MLGGKALRGQGLFEWMHTINCGCGLITETFSGYGRGVGLTNVARIPYFPEPALAFLHQYETIILVDIKKNYVTFLVTPGLIVTC